MAQKKNQQFRVAKINILKSVARRPKSLLRPTKIHQSKNVYSRKRDKHMLEKEKQQFISDQD